MQDQRKEEGPVIESPVPSSSPPESNGDTKITIRFDPEKQIVSIDYDTTKVKTWGMVLAILEMGRLSAETARHMAISENVQRASQRALEEQMVRAQLESEQGQRRIIQ